MYKKIKTLGKGAFGVVYKATDLTTGETVALKKYAFSPKNELNYQVLREINILNYLNHPNIIKIKKVLFDKYLEIILEYGGQDLWDYIRNTPFNQRIKDVKDITKQIFQACDYIHRMGVMHRDIKPNNILINKENFQKIKICDFGTSKREIPFQDKRDTIEICTISYKAPEAFTEYYYSKHKFSFSFDVWSAGCVIFEIIFGATLFKGNTEIVVLKNILNTIPVEEEDLILLNLENINLNSCNTEKFFKLPQIYDINTETKDVLELESLKKIIYKMLILNPEKRLSFSDLLKLDYFIIANITESQDLLIEKKILHRDNFFIRTKLPEKINIDIRFIYINFMFDLYESYKLNKQTVFLAINIFDLFLIRDSPKQGINIQNSLRLVSAACITLASKYIDLKPININIMKECLSEFQLVYWEKYLFKMIDFEINYITLLDIYRDLYPEKEKISEEHWKIIQEIILKYIDLEDKNIDQIKKLLTTYL